ncbi:hypothetical protein OV203_02960 [Nannocystis sp. ILAH1]|uniref:hypothetical protein n=1 Tax=unclassified Nannocystis TaxID=2627009 RepID=UPI00226E4FC9|nr:MULTISPECIES: hypothetical protein [unclassified Nannocystis]MCY0986072.1 hypothetical protein [Nannocystis sp. ILAH1]MCY1068668.1 hypothetical protein [Nannocystis sp. RBIL2]
MTIRGTWVATALLAVACGGGGGGETETEATAASTDGTAAGPTTMSSETASTGGPSPTSEPTTAGPTSDPTTGPGTSGPTTDTTAGPTTEPGTTTNTTGPDTTTGAGDDSTLCASQAEGLFFPADAIWYHDASSDPVAPDSAAITQWMVQNSPPNGWGTGTMRIDFSITAIDAPAGTEKRTYELDNDYYYSPDCDVAPIPLPPGGVVEDYPQDIPPADSFEGYDCSGYQDGADCHMIVVSRSEQRLYEVYHATVDAQSDQFTAGCLALWDTSKTYDLDGRGQQCTSADAAGFPIAPLLFSAEEVAAGEINHAIRFILPNSMIRAKKYVAPATHGTNTTGPMTSIPYGGHMRLRADYPVENLSPGAQVIAKALQKYGMYMSDGGNIALTAQSDVYGCATWDDVGVDPFSLEDLKATDFEVIDHGPTIDVTYECERTPIME